MHKSCRYHSLHSRKKLATEKHLPKSVEILRSQNSRTIPTRWARTSPEYGKGDGIRDNFPALLLAFLAHWFYRETWLSSCVKKRTGSSLFIFSFVVNKNSHAYINAKPLHTFFPVCGFVLRNRHLPMAVGWFFFFFFNALAQMTLYLTLWNRQYFPWLGTKWRPMLALWDTGALFWEGIRRLRAWQRSWANLSQISSFLDPQF